MFSKRKKQAVSIECRPPLPRYITIPLTSTLDKRFSWARNVSSYHGITLRGRIPNLSPISSSSIKTHVGAYDKEMPRQFMSRLYEREKVAPSQNKNRSLLKYCLCEKM